MAAAAPAISATALKLATFTTNGSNSTVGIVSGDSIWPLDEDPAIDGMVAAIKQWDVISKNMRLEVGKSLQLCDVQLQAPIPRPSGAIMCIGKNYKDHVKEMDKWKTAPALSAQDVPKAPQSVIGPGAAIRYPHGVSSQLDYEAELAVIIGKPGRSIKKKDALDHVFGYTILNDVSARDLQKQHQQWFIGKSCDTFCPMGPWIVPATEINGQDLKIQCWINDELRQDGHTSDMIFPIAELIEVISAGITLQAGDIIATGTPSGVGAGFDPPRLLRAGDVVSIEIEGIGTLRNQVE